MKLAKGLGGGTDWTAQVPKWAWALVTTTSPTFTTILNYTSGGGYLIAFGAQNGNSSTQITDVTIKVTIDGVEWWNKSHRCKVNDLTPIMGPLFARFDTSLKIEAHGDTTTYAPSVFATYSVD